MGAAIAILIIFLLLLGFGVHLAGRVLHVVVSLMALVLLVTLVARVLQRLTGRGQSIGRPWPPPRHQAGPDLIEAGRVCPNRHCGRVNEARARFCAVCGSPLR